MLRDGEPVTFAAVAKRAEVSHWLPRESGSTLRWHRADKPLIPPELSTPGYA
ncbi:hypothetical protein ACFYUY_34870 [Kitasatospora sp. NPDC004745]|uniref:hypothetical protein n=1 Tax=Kitasatospora sp. NPDC004745 TaxID=3364019 RepID=UPI0036A0C5BF